MDVDLRKLAADVVGRTALEERFGQRQLSALDAVTLEKISRADHELLKVAAQLSDGNILKTYEALGGEYKEGGIGTMAMGGLEALAKHPGIATAGGAVLGAGAGALAGGPNHRLSGAVAGGAAGAGLGYGASKLDAGLTGMARKANPAGMAEVDMLHRHNEELQGYLKSQRAGLIKQKIAGSLEMYEKLGGKYDRPPKGADEQTTTEHELAVEHFHDLMKSDPALAKQRYGSLKQIWRDHFDVANPPSRKYAK